MYQHIFECVCVCVCEISFPTCSCIKLLKPCQSALHGSSADAVPANCSYFHISQLAAPATSGPCIPALPSNMPPASDVDVIVPSSGPSLDWLEGWRDVLKGHHLIIIRTSGSAQLKVPEGFNSYEIHTAQDAQARLKEQAWCVSTKDSLSRSYGFLVSKKPYVFTIGAWTTTQLRGIGILWHLDRLSMLTCKLSCMRTQRSTAAWPKTPLASPLTRSSST